MVVAVDSADLFAGLFILGEVGDLWSDVCQWQGSALIPGPTVEDLAAALAAVEGFESSEPADVTIDGYQGQHVRLTVPEDADVDACNNGEHHGIAGFYAFGPGQVQDIWALDLDGTRTVLFTTWDANAPDPAQEDVAGMASSLEIEPVAP